MKRILVVDDSDDLQELFARFLKKAYLVETAGNGSQALERLKTKSFDLVITDIIMPGMNGYDMITQIKDQHPAMKIMAITGVAFPGASCNDFLNVAQRQGVDSVLVKPIGKACLLEEVALQLR